MGKRNQTVERISALLLSVLLFCWATPPDHPDLLARTGWSQKSAPSAPTGISSPCDRRLWNPPLRSGSSSSIQRSACCRGNRAKGMFGQALSERRLADNQPRRGEPLRPHAVDSSLEPRTEPKISEIMTPRPITVTPEETIIKAAQLMLEKTFAGLPVVDDVGQFVGIISDLDVMTSDLMPGSKSRIDDMDSLFPSPDIEWSTFRSLKKQLKKIKGRTVQEAMTPASEVKCVSPDSTVDDTANVLIRHRLRRVPVVQHGKLVGMVTRGDIMRSGLRRLLEASKLNK